MKILVTGATGYLGSHIVKSLLSNGHSVIILTRNFSNFSRIAAIENEISIYNVDKCELSRPFKEHDHIDSIIHTATCYGRNNESASEVYHANFTFPRKLLETASSFHCRTFLNTDTYFNKPRMACAYLTDYVLSKRQFLEWSKNFSSANDISFVNIMLEHIYGPNEDDTKFTSSIIKSCILNYPQLDLTEGTQRRDFIYVDDVVNAYLVLNRLQQGMGIHNYQLGSGKTTSIRKFVEIVHKLTQSSTLLKFGALPFRENEILESRASIGELKSLGWLPKIGLFDGIRRVVEIETYKLKNGNVRQE